MTLRAQAILVPPILVAALISAFLLSQEGELELAEMEKPIFEVSESNNRLDIRVSGEYRGCYVSVNKWWRTLEPIDIKYYVTLHGSDLVAYDNVPLYFSEKSVKKVDLYCRDGQKISIGSLVNF